jgi:hypothetical protein
MTVGRMESAGVVTTIDLGGIGVVASSSTTLIGAGMFLRGPNGEFYSLKTANISDPADAQGRTELVRYDSPTVAGFIFSASLGEAGDQWGAMLRYAGEFSGFRVAAGIGYERITDKRTVDTGTAIDIPQFNGATNDTDIRAWGGSLALLHVPSGLFAQGQYFAADFGDGTGTLPSSADSSAYWSDFRDHKDSHAWQIQAGISKNWFGLGNTSLYGEYARLDNWGAAVGAGRNWAVPTGSTGFTAVNGVTDTELTVYGLGIVQNIDAAATELYLGWRHYKADVTCTGLTADCDGAAGGAAKKLPTENLDVVVGGARVKF